MEHLIISPPKKAFHLLHPCMDVSNELVLTHIHIRMYAYESDISKDNNEYQYLHICIFCSIFYRSMYIFISTYLSFCQGDPLQDEGHEPQRLRRSLQNLHRDPPQEYNRRMKN